MAEQCQPSQKDDMSDMFRRAMFDNINLVGRSFSLFLSHYQSLFLCLSLNFSTSLSVSKQAEKNYMSDMFRCAMFKKINFLGNSFSLFLSNYIFRCLSLSMSPFISVSEHSEKEDMSDMFRRAMFEKMNLVGRSFSLFLSLF